MTMENNNLTIEDVRAALGEKDTIIQQLSDRATNLAIEVSKAQRYAAKLEEENTKLHEALGKFTNPEPKGKN